jgi:hypothetical protein
MDVLTEKKQVDRRRVSSLLARKYMKDYETSLAEFPDNKKVEFLEHLLECLDIIEVYVTNPSTENWKAYANKENTFLKKHGKRLKMYNQNRMYLYYTNDLVLIEKDIYTTDEWNALDGDMQALRPEEFEDFIDLCRRSLYLERHYLLLQQIPEDEREENLAGKNPNFTQEKTDKRRKITRDANDKMTCLSQEQTSLLVYFLQQEKVFLRGNYLYAKEIGSALEILTGYSENTIRTSIGDVSKIHSIVNLKEIDKLFGRMKTTVEQTIKELSPKKHLYK